MKLNNFQVSMNNESICSLSLSLVHPALLNSLSDGELVAWMAWQSSEVRQLYRYLDVKDKALRTWNDLIDRF